MGGLPSHLEVADILDRNRAVYVGCDRGTNQFHRLFYSAKDDAFFVAIQDSVTGTVVTILPLKYHENLAWSIQDYNLQIAKEKGRPTGVSTTNGKVSADPRQSFIIKIRYFDSVGAPKAMKLGTVPSEKYSGDLNNLLSDDVFLSMLDSFLEEKKIETEAVVMVSIQLGNKGEPVYFDL